MAFKILYNKSLDFKSKYYYMSIESIPIKELRKILRQHKIRGVGKLNKKELMELIEGNKEVLEGAGFFDTLRRLGTSVSKGVSRAVSLPVKGLKRIFTPSKWWNNTSENTLSKFGNDNVVRIQIYRTPLSGMLNTLMSALSFGKIDELKKKYGYDKFYHLALIATVMSSQGEKNIIVEKNEAPFITTVYETSELTEMMSLDRPIPPNLTLKNMLDNTIASVGVDRFFLYDAFTTNCQMFLVDILKTNDLLTEKAREFIYQDMTQLAEELPQAFKGTARALTDVGAVVSKLRGKGKDDEKGETAAEFEERERLTGLLAQMLEDYEKTGEQQGDKGLETGFIESDIIEPPTNLSDTSQLPAFSGAGDPSLMTYDLREIENYELSVNPLSTSTPEEIKLQQEVFRKFLINLYEYLYVSVNPRFNISRVKRLYIVCAVSIIREFVRYVFDDLSSVIFDSDERVIRNFKRDDFSEHIRMYIDYLMVSSGTKDDADTVLNTIMDTFIDELSNGERIGRYIAFDIIDRFRKDNSKQPYYLDFIKDKGELRPDLKKYFMKQFKDRPYGAVDNYVQNEFKNKATQLLRLSRPQTWNSLTVNNIEVDGEDEITFFEYYCSEISSQLLLNTTLDESVYHIETMTRFILGFIVIVLRYINRGIDWMIQYSQRGQNNEARQAFRNLIREYLTEQVPAKHMVGIIKNAFLKNKKSITIDEIIKKIFDIFDRREDEDGDTTNFVSDIWDIVADYRLDVDSQLYFMQLMEAVDSVYERRPEPQIERKSVVLEKRGLGMTVLLGDVKEKDREKFRSEYDEKKRKKMLEKNPDDSILVAYYNNTDYGPYQKCLNIIGKIEDREKIDIIKKIYPENGKNYLFILNRGSYERTEWKDKDRQKYYNFMHPILLELLSVHKRPSTQKNFRTSLTSSICGQGGWIESQFLSCGCYVANLRDNILEISTISRWSIQPISTPISKYEICPVDFFNEKDKAIYIDLLCGGGGAGEIFKQLSPQNYKKFLEVENQINEKFWNNFKMLYLSSLPSYNTLNFYFRSNLYFNYQFFNDRLDNAVLNAIGIYLEDYKRNFEVYKTNIDSLRDDIIDESSIFSAYENILSQSPLIITISGLKDFYLIYDEEKINLIKVYQESNKKSLFSNRTYNNSETLLGFLSEIMEPSKNDLYRGKSKTLYNKIIKTYSMLDNQIKKIKPQPREPRRICEDDYIRYVIRPKPEGGAKIAFQPKYFKGTKDEKIRKQLKYMIDKQINNVPIDLDDAIKELLYIIYEIKEDYSLNSDELRLIISYAEDYLNSDFKNDLLEVYNTVSEYDEDPNIDDYLNLVVRNFLYQFRKELGITSSSGQMPVEIDTEKVNKLRKELKKLLINIFNGVINSNIETDEDAEPVGEGLYGGAIGYGLTPSNEKEIKETLNEKIKKSESDEWNEYMLEIIRLLIQIFEKYDITNNDEKNLIINYVEDYTDDFFKEELLNVAREKKFNDNYNLFSYVKNRAAVYIRENERELSKIIPHKISAGLTVFDETSPEYKAYLLNVKNIIIMILNNFLNYNLELEGKGLYGGEKKNYDILVMTRNKIKDLPF